MQKFARNVPPGRGNGKGDLEDGGDASQINAVFVTWEAHCTRSENQARHLGAEVISISYGRSLPTVVGTLIRYVISTILTLSILWRRNPEVVFTMNQPIFLLVAVAAYCRLRSVPFIIDSHSGAFNDPKWQWSVPIYKTIARRALLNINTNDHHKNLVESWGGKSTIIADIPIYIDEIISNPNRDEPYIAVVTSFSFDEPVAEIFEAARKVPEMNFYMTGNFKKLPQSSVDMKPANVSFTGFISYAEYLGLLQGSTGVMVLTTRDNTMQRGAYEALSLAVPIITSDFKVLRDCFADASIYVDNTAGDIARAVRDLHARNSEMRQAACKQKLIRERYYDNAIVGIKDAYLHAVE
jgi:glycosyltransferase involved in cell wall biosynthesis